MKLWRILTIVAIACLWIGFTNLKTPDSDLLIYCFFGFLFSFPAALISFKIAQDNEDGSKCTKNALKLIGIYFLFENMGGILIFIIALVCTVVHVLDPPKPWLCDGVYLSVAKGNNCTVVNPPH
jgi:hypothetical protein